jgi:hypothetical protein
MRRAKGQFMVMTVARVPSGNLDTMGLAKKLLEHGANINARLDWKDDPSPPTLGSTAGSGIRVPTNLSITKYNFVTFVGATPFYLAAFNADPTFMRFLAANGADPMIPTRQNVTPLLGAAGIGYMQAGHLNDDNDVMEAVKVAYELGNDAKAVVDFSDYDSTGDWRWNHANALHGAAARGNLALIKWLADKGVSFEQKTEAGWIPLHAAEGIWMTGFIQHQLAADKLIRQLMTERGLPLPRPRTEEEIQTDGVGRKSANSQP